MNNAKKNVIIVAVIMIAFAVGFFVNFLVTPASKTVTTTGALTSPSKNVSAEEIYPMFLCPCCGQPLDKNNICCDMAKDMIAFIDSQVAAGLSENDVIMKTVEKYGINSVIEPKRKEITTALANKNPELFPKETLSFSDAIGKKAPDFTLEDINGNKVRLSDYKGKIVVLFFNEGSMCYPACWDQMAELGNDERFSSNDTVTFSILVDQKSEWQKIIGQVPKLSKARILFDPTRAVSSAYDVLSLKSSMHPGSYPGHTYFVIDKEGIVRYTFDDPNMAIWNDRIADETEKLR